MLNILLCVLGKLLLFILILIINRSLKAIGLSKKNFHRIYIFLETLLLYSISPLTKPTAILLISNIIIGGFIAFCMRKYNLIGLTGGIGSGKSTLMRQIVERDSHIAIIDSDKLVNDMLTKQGCFIWIVKKIFLGRDILREDGSLDKKKIGFLIFDRRNKSLKKKYLAAVFANLGFQIIKNIITVFAWEGYYTAILDAPTLFETKVLVPICFPIITVYVENNEMLMDRLKLRSRKSLLAKGNDINEKTLESMIKDINNKIENQYPMEVKKKKSDIAINNNGTEEELYQNFVVSVLKFLN